VAGPPPPRPRPSCLAEARPPAAPAPQQHTTRRPSAEHPELDGITAIAVSHRYCFSSKAIVGATALRTTASASKQQRGSLESASCRRCPVSSVAIARSPARILDSRSIGLPPRQDVSAAQRVAATSGVNGNCGDTPW
jgi:hypothetical protein